ncbi:ABC transporter permease [Imperialibacter roseus]|uniref:ABC transporter permease n=1 Tax=Imperialibacter roseus TaxID=1324217 RepID=A0ABZ0IWK9_9BACT|nr:ABC transporter permease [Imperialibacter roseus]WOK08305.1 ABC transporter permease [Imperialibacter roseus]
MDNQQLIERHIIQWRQQLRKQKNLEDGVIAELEDHLRQSIERLQTQGCSAEDACKKAIEELGTPADINEEEHSVQFRYNGSYWPLLGSYFLIALRNIRHRKFIASINVLGLTLGVAVSLLLGVYAYDIITYDQFHENADDIYFLYRTRPTPEGGQIDVSDTWPPLAEEVQKAIPGVKNISRIIFGGQTTIRYNGQDFSERMAFGEQGMFKMFSFPLVRGHKAQVFANPRSVVISQNMAERLFGDADPIGKTIELQLATPVSYEVTGVFGEFPFNSSFNFNMLVNMESRRQQWIADGDYGWVSSFVLSFLQLENGKDPATLKTQFPQLVEKFVTPSERGTLELMPLADYYDFNTGQQQYGYFLEYISFGLLLIAFFNFANLNAAQSLGRFKEVAVRKTFGAGGKDLVLQFTGETTFLFAVGSILGIALAFILLPYFIDLFGQQMSLAFLFEPMPLVSLLAGIIGLGLVAGIYPTLTLSKLKAGEVMHGSTSLKRSGFDPKNILVTCQFAIAVMLVSAVLIMYQQINFMKTADMNFDPDNVLIINARSGEGEENEQRWAAFRNSLEAVPGVKSVSASNSAPGRYSGSFVLVQSEDARDRAPLDWRFVSVDDKYFATMDIDFVQGRDFDIDMRSDQRKSVINQAAMKQLGWASVEGHKLMFPDSDEGFEVIGVVKDFNFRSLANAVEPVIHVFRGRNSNRYNMLLVRLNAAGLSETMAQIESAWKGFDANHPIDYTFVDQQFQNLYETEERIGSMTLYATFMAILVAVLGILGLASFTVAQRMKEMAIRKVLGASVQQLLMILLKQTTLLFLASLLIAVPLNYYVMNDWLEGFAFRINLGPFAYLLAAGIVMVTSWVVLGSYALKSLKTNPARTLRSE